MLKKPGGFAKRKALFFVQAGRYILILKLIYLIHILSKY